jgi:glycosyltransferase involved in cell wall biosynthesis
MEHRKKIAFMGLRGYPANFNGLSGVDVRVEKAIDNLAKKYQVDVYVRSWCSQKKDISNKNIQKINIFSINNKYLDSFLYGFLSCMKIIITPAKIIFVETSNFGFFLPLLKIVKKKVIVTFHSSEWQREKWNWFGKISLRLSEALSVLFADKIIVVSRLLADYLTNSYHEEKKIIVIPHYFTKKKPPQPKFVKKYNLKKDNYILYFGRLSPEKRVEWLIKAYKELNLKNKLVIVGAKTGETKYYSQIKALINKNKENIIYFNGLFGQEKEEMLANCKLFVNPSEFEGSSISLLEALSYGRKVLVSDILENKEILINQAQLFKVNNFRDLKLKILNLLNKKYSKSDNWHYLHKIYLSKEKQDIIYNNLVNSIK